MARIFLCSRIRFDWTLY